MASFRHFGSSEGELLIERMASPEVATLVERGFTRVVLPFGATEQHGPHLPLGVDSMHAEYLARAVARRLPRTLVAPTIRIGCSAHHMGFAGTVTLSAETFTAVYRECCESLADHGFDTILCFSAHGGNFAPLRQATPLVRRSLTGCQVVTFTDHAAWMDVWRSAVGQFGLPAAQVGGHADVAETSVMLALAPALVGQEQAEVGAIGSQAREWSSAGRRPDLRTITPNGVLGDPTGADAALGHRCLEAMADLLVRYFETARSERVS